MTAEHGAHAAPSCGDCDTHPHGVCWRHDTPARTEAPTTLTAPAGNRAERPTSA